MHMQKSPFVGDMVTRAYQTYFGSGTYDRRYPQPNALTLDRILAYLPPAAHVIDYGCGSGRYLLALKGRVLRAAGFDISAAAIEALRRKSAEAGWDDLAILGPDPEALSRHVAEAGHADLVLCLFGVLGHVEDATARRRVLAEIRGLLRPCTGRLVISVPNRHRRFRREQRRAGPETDAFVHYQRKIGASEVTLPYQLYDKTRLSRELTEAGFGICEVRAESIFPESWLTRGRALRRVDRMLASLCPANWGYGILAVASA